MTGPGKLSPVCFALALLCFGLPFMSVSCQNQKLLTMSGLETMAGKDVDVVQMLESAGKNLNVPGLKLNPKDDPNADPAKLAAMNQARHQHIKGSPLAIGAFLCGIVGLVLYLVNRKNGPVPALLGVAGAGLVAGMKSYMESQIQNPTFGVIRVDGESGYWAALLCFGAAAVLNGWLALQPDPPPKIYERPGPPPMHVTGNLSRSRAYPVFPDGASPGTPPAAGDPALEGDVPRAPRAPIPVHGAVPEDEHEPAGR